MHYEVIIQVRDERQRRRQHHVIMQYQHEVIKYERQEIHQRHVEVESIVQRTIVTMEAQITVVRT